MTLAEMKVDVRRRLNESGTEFFSDADIANSLQEGLDEIADITEYFEREAQIQLLTGRTYYDLTTILPDTFLSPRRVWNATTQRWLTPTTARNQDENTFVQWELTYGTPQSYLMRGNWWFGVWPRNTNDIGSVRFYGTAIPEDLGDDEEPAFPADFHPAVPEYALCDLIGQMRETDKALLYWASFMEYMGRMAGYVSQRQKLARRDAL